MRSPVLPEPAGACTMNERAASSAARRACASWARSRSRACGGSLTVLSLCRRPAVHQLPHAAERGEIAMLAGIGVILRRDLSAAGEIFARESFEHRAPALEQGVPVGVMSR